MWNDATTLIAYFDPKCSLIDPTTCVQPNMPPIVTARPNQSARSTQIQSNRNPHKSKQTEIHTNPINPKSTQIQSKPGEVFNFISDPHMRYEIEMISVYFFVFFLWKILHFPKNFLNIFGNFCAVEKILNNFMEFFT